MPLSTVTVTFDISDLAGVDFDPRRTKVYATTNVPGGVIVDTSGNQIRLGSGNATIAADGTGSITLWAPGTGSNPDSWQTTIHVDYPDRNADRGRKVQVFGPFTITTSANLADLVEEQAVPPTYLTTITAQLDTYVASASASATTAAASATSAAASAAAAAAGGGGGSSSLTVSAGGTIDLDNTKPNGYLIGYRFTGTATVEGTTLTAGSYIFERNTSVTSGWTYRTLAAPAELEEGAEPDPGDVTAPTAGTLAGSAITDTTFTLTVTGASDTGGLHSTPYAFSTDNGSTYSAYQPSAVYNVTGKTASTGYQCRHRVRDAAGNVSTGTATTVTTSAPAEVHTLFDTMTGANSTLLTAHTPDIGGAWTKPLGTGVLTLNGSGAAAWSGVGGSFTAYAQGDTTGTEGTAVVDLIYGSSGDAEVGPALRVTGTGDKFVTFCKIGASEIGVVAFSPGVSVIGTTLASLSLPTGEVLRFVLDISGSTVLAKINRLSDNTWLNTSKAWVSGETHCITGTIGSSWSGSPGIAAAQPDSNGTTIDRFHYDA